MCDELSVQLHDESAMVYRCCGDERGVAAVMMLLGKW
jgi:hypothetical protein